MPCHELSQAATAARQKQSTVQLGAVSRPTAVQGGEQGQERKWPAAWHTDNSSSCMHVCADIKHLVTWCLHRRVMPCGKHTAWWGTTYGSATTTKSLHDVVPACSRLHTSCSYTVLLTSAPSVQYSIPVRGALRMMCTCSCFRSRVATACMSTSINMIFDCLVMHAALSMPCAANQGPALQ
jgi:hypothetical protein